MQAAMLDRVATLELSTHLQKSIHISLLMPLSHLSRLLHYFGVSLRTDTACLEHTRGPHEEPMRRL